ncbi:hypothetical protein J2Z21_003357 [Streptomyces griseochromogenes]|uniref:Uncharacterized protein n=1 Tax=Streptomyces griseochromogenes TaxID=68214 RepID=A0ABS4LSN5_9ACTN|nr:hypothetical protein [Streptomyces griseochromogenes]MBP2050418.1 hypothetical protein [Streptomyces griseochromogenes]
MRKFQRAAVVAAAVAGLSVLGVGVSFAGGEEGYAPPSQQNAVANSQANAVATWGGGYYSMPHYGPDKAAEEPTKEAPEEGGYGQYSDGSK